MLSHTSTRYIYHWRDRHLTANPVPLDALHRKILKDTTNNFGPHSTREKEYREQDKDFEFDILEFLLVSPNAMPICG